MLLKRSFWPVNDVPPPGVFTIWGAVLTKSLNARFNVGSRRNAESEMKLPAPVRAVESSGFEAQGADGQGVGAAHVHVLEGVPSIISGSRGVALTRGSVDQRELSGGDGRS